jgi:hypothetical protein
MCTPPLFNMYVLSKDYETVDIDPNTNTTIGDLPVDSEILFDVLQLLIDKLTDSESYSDFVTPVLFALHAACKTSPNIKNTLYQWIVQNVNWPERFV